MASSHSLFLQLHFLTSPSFILNRHRNPSSCLSFYQAHFKKSFASSSSSNHPSPSSSWEREETRWIREEQRWLREEQRWVRQETRWNVEKQSLLEEIENLKKKIQELEERKSGSAFIEVVKGEDKVGELNLIAESRSVSKMFFDSNEVVKEMVESAKEFESATEIPVDEKKVEWKKKKKIVSLRMGSEGEDVQKLQKALQKLGFYSGEEDMEFSSFSTGTERAVKTWQASLEIPEDGIVTAELLDILLMVKEIDDANVNVNTNGAPTASETKVSETTNETEEKSTKEFDKSYHKVFLLGENRWEEPSRLTNRDKPVLPSKTTKCLPCRGEGRVMCTECDGSGELNVEEQFMEWADDGMKCLYCGGLGYTICNVCEGKTVAPT